MKKADKISTLVRKPPSGNHGIGASCFGDSSCCCSNKDQFRSEQGQFAVTLSLRRDVVHDEGGCHQLETECSNM